MRLPVPFVAAGILAAAVFAAGCDRSTDGVATADSSQVGKTVPTGQVESVLLIPKEMSEIAGAELRPRLQLTRSVPGGMVSGPCAGLTSVGADGFVGDSYSALRLVLSTDGEGASQHHVAAQAAGIYPDDATAREAFSAATNGLGGCNGRQVRNEAEWLFAVPQVTADSVRWNKIQKDAQDTWVCHGQARLRDNVIIQAMACQGDEGGEAKADTILNKMSATIWELAGR